MKYGREFLPRYLRIVTSVPPPQLLAEAANEIERLQALLAEALKPKDIWHDCSHCQGHEPSDS